MTSSITSCQANALLSLQRELMESGLMVTVGECTAACTSTPAATTTSRAPRKVAAVTAKPRRGRPPKSAGTAPATKARKMSTAGKKAIAGAASAYHAKIRELRDTEDLTTKQARALYQEMKTDGVL